ncbi:MAG: VOC family protein [Bdellovibrionota bacterium]
MIAHTIIYVKNQSKSKEFYSKILGVEPKLDVPGMTEFQLSESHILGLMPEKDIKKLLGPKLPDPVKSNGQSRVELYLRVHNPDQYFETAINSGATELSPILERDWGDYAGYVLDPDGHVIAFATNNSLM